MIRTGKAVLLALAAVAAMATVAQSALASAPTNDINTLAGSLFANPARYVAAGSAVVQQPQVSNVDATVAPTLAAIEPPFNGFPASGKSIFLASGEAAELYTSGLSDGQYYSTDTSHGGANDITTVKFAFNVPAGGDCVSFNYRIYTQESIPQSHFSEGLVAQLDASNFVVDSTTPKAEVTAPGDFAVVNGQLALISNLGSDFTNVDLSASSFAHASSVYTATSPVTAGAHALFLSTFDVGDWESDTGAQVSGFNVGTMANGTCGQLVPSTAFTFGKTTSKNGTASLGLVLPNPGTVTVYDANGPKVTVASVGAAKKKKKKVALIKKTVFTAPAAGPVTIKLKPTSAGKKLLKSKGKFKVKLAIAFKANEGTLVTTQHKTITVKAKKKKKHKH